LGTRPQLAAGGLFLFTPLAGFGYTDRMADSIPNRRWFNLTPDRLILGLLLIESSLLLSEWFRLLPRGWAVLTAMGTIGVAVVSLLFWLAAALRFGWRFQFGVRSLLILAPVGVILCGLMAIQTRWLVGLSLDDIKARLGPWNYQQQLVVPASYAGGYFGPRPRTLKPSDKYLAVNYYDYRGEQICIFAVSPQVYERVKGVSPGDREAYVLEVYTAPKGTVY